MHALENYCLLKAEEYRRRGDMRTANTFNQLVSITASYVPEGEEPATILQLNARLIARTEYLDLCDEVLAFIRRKRRTSSEHLRAFYRVWQCPEPDEDWGPVDFRRLQRALSLLVRRGLIRRYGHGAYLAVPARERIGPRPG
jgi:hypothetical protein